MTPAEREEIRRLMQQIVQPLQEQIDALKHADRQHTREFDASLRRSATELREERNGDLAGVSLTYERLLRSVRSIEEKVDEVRTTSASIAPAAAASEKACKGAEAAAVAGAKAAIAAEGKTDALAIDQGGIKSDTRTSARWAKITAITVSLITIVHAIVQIFRGQ